MKTSKNSQKEGGVLLLVMLMVLLMSILGLGLMRQARNDAVETSQLLNRTRAFWLAEAGLQEFGGIVSKATNRLPLEDIGLVGSSALSDTLPGGGSYVVDIQPVVAARLYRVTSMGTAPGGAAATLTTVVQANRFSDRVWSTHSEETSSGGNIYFAPGDRIDGEVYSNDEFNIYGTPEFLKLARTGADSINYWGSRPDDWVDPAVFTEGLLLGQDELDFGVVVNHISSISSEADIALSPGDSDITVNGSQVISINRSTGVTVTNSVSSGDIVLVNGDAYIEGDVGTRVSFVTTGAIIITGDIIYSSTAANPNHSSSGFNPNPNEVLGLFSGSQIRVQSGVGEVNIHASIFVTKDNVGSNNNGFWTEDRYSSVGTPYINLFGSISQYRRGVIGQMGGNGYLKNYGYDERLLVAAPPGIPISDYSQTREWEQL